MAFGKANGGFPALGGGVAAVGDYDNDGLLDILVSGWDSVSNVNFTQLWRNTGSGFESVPTDLPQYSCWSAAWGDYDNDGRLDLLLTYTDSNYVDHTEIWRNTGSGFSNVTAFVAPDIPGIEYGSAAWGDFDNDGKLDILLTGYSYVSGEAIAQVWRNTGNGFVQSGIVLPGVEYSSCGLVDFDGDGLPDIYLSGSANNGYPLTQLWHNTGHGFTNLNLNITQMEDASFGWGDFNNDGKLDFVVSGYFTSQYFSHSYTQVWTNSGSGFVKMADLAGLSGGSVSVADFDNDGLPDIVLTGSDDNGNAVTKLYRNTGTGFVDVTAIFTPGIPNVYGGFSTWADFDGDGRLELLLGGNGTMQVWQNMGLTNNTPPTAPTGLTASVSGSSLVLNWMASSDAQTPSAGLTYNLRIGTTPGGSEVLEPNSGPAGRRRLAQIGPLTGQQFQLTLGQYAEPRYYCSVQSIDGGLASSPFSPEVEVTVPPMFTSWGRRQDGTFQAQFNVTSGVTYDIQASSDLLHWSDLLLFNLDASGPFIFTDPSAANYPHRYYRVGAQRPAYSWMLVRGHLRNRYEG